MDSLQVLTLRSSFALEFLNLSEKSVVQTLLYNLAEGKWILLKGCAKVKGDTAKEKIIYCRVRKREFTINAS